MDIIITIKHWLKTKIYNSFLSIQAEKVTTIIGAMKKIGYKPSIHPECCFRGMEYMEIGDNFHSGKNAWVDAIDKTDNQIFHPRLLIGDNFSMQQNCHIACVEYIEIGNNVLLGSKVLITDHLHGKISADELIVPPIERLLSSKPVIIGHNVWIGDNVTILPGVTLGNGVIVGANAVVTKSFPNNRVIGGCPAKVLKILK